MATTKSEKPIHTLILDAGPIIKGEPAVSSMLQQCEQIISTPAVISEIRDLTTRTRLQTTLLPFLILRRPMPESVEFVAAFARRTGDYSVLSRADVELLALAYDLECERNNGDWRLRKTPGQKRTNAPPPAGVNQELLGESSQVQLLDGQEGLAKSHAQSDEANQPEHHREVRYESEERQIPSESHADESREGLQKRPYYSPTQSPTKIKATLDIQNWPAEPLSIENRVLAQDFITNQLRKAHLSHEGPVSEDSLANQPGETHLSTQEDQDDESLEDSDAEGWITPSNIKKKQLEDSYIAGTTAMVPKVMQAVSLHVNFNLNTTDWKRLQSQQISPCKMSCCR